MLAAALLLGPRWQLLTLAAAGLLFVPTGTIKASSGLLYETESSYQYIQIVERSDGSRALKLNEGVAVHSVWHEDSVLTGGVWDTFLLVPPLLDRPVEKMLVIGNAGGTVARAYGELYPDVEIDGVEIDPEVSEAARRWLGLNDNPNLSVITDDGRPFLELRTRRTTSSSSTPTQPYIPFYLATREFFRAVRADHRRGRGAERRGRARRRAAVRGIGSTLLAEFPEAWRWRPLRFSELMLGFDAEVGATRSSSGPGAAGRVESLVPLFQDGPPPVVAVEQPLTDDRAPVGGFRTA